MRVPLLLLVCATATACSSVQDSLTRPFAEVPPDGSESYLTQREGPRTQVDLGGGEEPLFARFKTVTNENIELRKREKLSLADLDGVRTSLQRCNDDLERAKKVQASQEADNERLRKIRSEHELKILHLHLQIAQLQHSKLLLEIAAIERELQDGDAGLASPGPAPGSDK